MFSHNIELCYEKICPRVAANLACHDQPAHDVQAVHVMLSLLKLWKFIVGTYFTWHDPWMFLKPELSAYALSQVFSLLTSITSAGMHTGKRINETFFGSRLFSLKYLLLAFLIEIPFVA